MHTKIYNIDIIMGSETNDIIEEFCESPLQKYQEGLEESMKGTEFIFHSVALLHYHLQKTSLKRIGLPYTDSQKWLKNEKTTTNPKNNDDNCFQYASAATLDYQNIKSHPERILRTT